MPAVSAEFPVDAAARTGVDLRGYRQLRLVVSVGLAGGLAGTVLKLRNSLDASATWADSGAELALTSTYGYPSYLECCPCAFDEPWRFISKSFLRLRDSL